MRTAHIITSGGRFVTMYDGTTELTIRTQDGTIEELRTEAQAMRAKAARLLRHAEIIEACTQEVSP